MRLTEYHELKTGSAHYLFPSFTDPSISGVAADCGEWGARGEHFPGLSVLWAWLELSVRVTADSSAVKSSHCELPP